MDSKTKVVRAMTLFGLLFIDEGLTKEEAIIASRANTRCLEYRMAHGPLNGETSMLERIVEEEIEAVKL